MLEGLVRDTPRGYRTISDVPVLRGHNHCEQCLCAPCIVVSPPDFLRGSCDPHPANSEKRHMLYKKFWRCLSTIGVWNDEIYLRRKEEQTARNDRREIIPSCIIEVSYPYIIYLMHLHLNLFRKFDGGIRAMMASIETTSARSMQAST